MLITKVSRSYSRSLNTRNYGLPESWIKIEATYEAQCESGDDATKISGMLAEQAKTDVLTGINQIITQIQNNKTGTTVPPAAAPTAPVAPVAPVAPAPAPTAPVAPAPVAPVPPLNESPRML